MGTGAWNRRVRGHLLRPPRRCPVLRHEPTGYWFAFSVKGESHQARYAPGVEAREESRNTVVWSNQLEAVRNWLIVLRHEITQPDLWAELERERQVVGELAPVENTPFTAEERQQIARQLGEVKAYVQKTRELSAAQSRALEARLDHLIEAADRLSRVDWRDALLGVFLSTIVEAILPGEVVRDALRFIVRGLGPMFGADPIPELPY